MFSIASKQRQNLCHAELGCVVLGASLDGLIGELALLVLQGKDSLFDSFLDSDFVDDNVNFLREAVDTVNGLFFNELKRY